MDTRIQRALEHLERHYADEVTLAGLARVACMSEWHFSRVFSLQLGRPVFAYVRELRIAAAKRLLSCSDRPIAEIASSVGFSTIPHFNESFKSVTGQSPRQYRRLAAERKIPEEIDKIPDAPALAAAHTPPISNFLRRIIEMNLSETNLPDMDVAFVSQTGSYLDTGPLWMRLMAWTAPQGLFPPACQFLGISYDEPEAEDGQKTSDACVVLPAGFSRPAGEEAGIAYKTVRGGRFLLYHFYDRVERLALAYRDTVTEYLPASAWELDDRDFLEFVMNDPFSDPEGKARIDLYIPVIPR